MYHLLRLLLHHYHQDQYQYHLFHLNLHPDLEEQTQSTIAVCTSMGSRAGMHGMRQNNELCNNVYFVIIFVKRVTSEKERRRETHGVRQHSLSLLFQI